jgi:hypothetical protein
MSFFSTSDDVEDQVAEALSCIVDQAIVIIKVGMEVPSTRRMGLHRCYINRDREAAYERLHRDYFVDDYVYSPTYFRRR